jgi:hypothetical protein
MKRITPKRKTKMGTTGYERCPKEGSKNMGGALGRQGQTERLDCKTTHTEVEMPKGTNYLTVNGT